MKRGKDEEKIMGPMFPRLHVNDTEKGGPRAPPRNKMALYEQLSIPSQRFTHVELPCNPSNTAANLLPLSSQGSGNDRGMFLPRQVRPRYPSEKQYSQYSELSTPLAPVDQRKKLDEDDYRVPIFIHSLPTDFDKYSNPMNGEKLLPSNPPYLHHSSKFKKAKETGVLENSMKLEGQNKKGENSNEFVASWKQNISSLSHEPGDNVANSIDRLITDDSEQPELCAESQLYSDTAKRNSSDSQKASPSEDQNIVHDLSNDTGSCEDGSCRPTQTANLERGDSVSESSVLDALSAPDITPDDIVGIIGQKHFWKARRAILDQQRIFAIQVFELHRLIKVQKLIASSPHLLEDSAYFGKHIKPLPGKKRPLDYAVKANSNASKGKSESEKPCHKKECSAENNIEKASFASAQNGVPPPSCRPPTGSAPAPSVAGSDHNARTACFNHPQAHQWLVPVMSPTEGLIYKPYPGSVVGQACGGCRPPGSNPMMGNFLTPAYGVPAPPTQYPFPSFPPFGPHGYFPPYGMPIMTTAPFSGSSIEQTNPTSLPGRFSAGEAMSTVPTQKNGAVPDGLSSRAPEEIEVQGSTSSSPTERRPRSGTSSNMLPLFPTSPAIDASNGCSQPTATERPSRVIKVVPHNGISASESAARIFRSIQEERKQYDSV